VRCEPDHAFEVWTTRIDQWWPKDHTLTGAAAVTMTFEPGVGGRLVERAPNGDEREWGRITRWAPPHGLAYTWLIGGPEAEATDVEVTFTHAPGGLCRVDIVHHGWERLGASGPQRRRANRRGWAALLTAYRGFLREADRPRGR
jgi:uncharacterized protein YndB with AHSA1/START domain